MRHIPGTSFWIGFISHDEMYALVFVPTSLHKKKTLDNQHLWREFIKATILFPTSYSYIPTYIIIIIIIIIIILKSCVL